MSKFKDQDAVTLRLWARFACDGFCGRRTQCDLDVKPALARWAKRVLYPPVKQAPQGSTLGGLFNGEGGIRTRGKDKPYTAFPRLLDQPLRHLSGNGI